MLVPALRSVAPALLAAAVSGCAILGNPYEDASDVERERMKHVNLPLQRGQTFKVRQGAFGSSSHDEPGNEYSWDLEVPLGTPVVAIEGGRVLDVHVPRAKKGAKLSGCDARYKDLAANLKVEHADGTVAQYVHVRPIVSEGEPVRAGDQIALTAANGWLCYPHLHFSVYKSRGALYASPARQTLPLLFDQVPGGILSEGFQITDRF